MSLDKKEIYCYILSPDDDSTSFLTDKKWKSKINFLGNKNNSCAFEFINITSNFFGRWILFSTYGSGSFKKDLHFDLKDRKQYFYSLNLQLYTTK